MVSIPTDRYGPEAVDLHVRRWGEGEPLLLLHGGWGQGAFPWDEAAAALQGRFRLLSPDRLGYGGSPDGGVFDVFLHRDAAAQMLAWLDREGIERAWLWGHSDGAVSAALMALAQPDRFSAVVLEALHLDRRKPRSRAFFQTMVESPEDFGEKVVEALRRDHGEPRWREVLAKEGRAWLEILDRAGEPDLDLYDGRLGDLAVPTLVLHGTQDPRTEPGELAAFFEAVPHAVSAVLDGAGHCPHAEKRVRTRALAAVAGFLAQQRK